MKLKFYSLFLLAALAAGSLCVSCNDDEEPVAPTPPALLTLTAGEGFHVDPFVAKKGTTSYDVRASLRFTSANAYGLTVAYGEKTSTTSSALVGAKEQQVRQVDTFTGTFAYDETTGELQLTPTPADTDAPQTAADEPAQPAPAATYTFNLVRNIMGEYVITGNFGTFASQALHYDGLTSLPSAIVLYVGAEEY